MADIRDGVNIEISVEDKASGKLGEIEANAQKAGDSASISFNAMSAASAAAQGNILGLTRALTPLINLIKGIRVSAMGLSVIGAVIGGAITIFNKWRDSVKEAKKRLEELKEVKLEEHIKDISKRQDELTKEIEKTCKAIDRQLDLDKKDLDYIREKTKAQIELNRQKRLEELASKNIGEAERNAEKSKINAEADAAIRQIENETQSAKLEAEISANAGKIDYLRKMLEKYEGTVGPNALKAAAQAKYDAAKSKADGLYEKNLDTFVRKQVDILMKRPENAHIAADGNARALFAERFKNDVRSGDRAQNQFSQFLKGDSSYASAAKEADELKTSLESLSDEVTNGGILNDAKTALEKAQKEQADALAKVRDKYISDIVNRKLLTEHNSGLDPLTGYQIPGYQDLVKSLRENAIKEFNAGGKNSDAFKQYLVGDADYTKARDSVEKLEESYKKVKDQADKIRDAIAEAEGNTRKLVLDADNSADEGELIIKTYKSTLAEVARLKEDADRKEIQDAERKAAEIAKTERDAAADRLEAARDAVARAWDMYRNPDKLREYDAEVDADSAAREKYRKDLHSITHGRRAGDLAYMMEQQRLGNDDRIEERFAQLRKSVFFDPNQEATMRVALAERRETDANNDLLRAADAATRAADSLANIESAFNGGED